MPELPEVESLAGLMRARAVGHAIAGVELGAVHVLKTYDLPPAALIGLLVTDVTRRGKFLDLDADGVHVVMHLARAGWLRWNEALPTAPLRPSGRSPVALRLRLDDGSGFDLTEAGTRKRLSVSIVRDPSEVPGVARLGMDVLDPAFTVEAFAAMLAAAGRARIKGVLIDQTVLAGVGNAYSDEVLWEARLSPFKPASSLDADAVATLHAAILRTLGDAVVRAEGVAADGLKAAKKTALQVHGKTGLPCPRCGDTIREVSYADKSWQYCATCQTGGEPLADRRLSRLLR
ncbi:MAG TPA: DNA-formamidopyrimidine glycosylase family protein [Mycobacteriales bacterium]|nr:DNA-formamidopyrimidine glycosylase family protein [Mycobacteriales bacterium]